MEGTTSSSTGQGEERVGQEKAEAGFESALWQHLALALSLGQLNGLWVPDRTPGVGPGTFPCQ